MEGHVNGRPDGLAVPGLSLRDRVREAVPLPPRRLGVVVGVQVACAAIALLLVSVVVPVDDRIALPLDLGIIDPTIAGIVVWIVVGLLTSARSARLEGRVALVYAVAPIVAAGWLGGPTAAAWVALLGTTEVRELNGEVPWYGALANHAMFVVPAILGAFATTFVFEAVGGPTNGFGGFVAVLVGAIVLISLNTAMAIHVVRERTGRSALETIGIPLGAYIAMPFAEAALGWAFAEAYVAVAWWIALVLVAAESTAESALALGHVEWFARHDSLTGLPNRRAVDERARDMRRRPPDRGAAVFFIDLDRFKQVNDVHEHAAGDRVLQVVAARLSAALRVGDLAARLGGDEFVFLASGIATKAEAERVRARLAAAIEAPIDIGGVVVDVGASIGYVLLAPTDDLNGAIRAADKRMYAAKHRTGNEAA
jgi:diguanylate cyclase (GGDEF)-like protein